MNLGLILFLVVCWFFILRKGQQNWLKCLKSQLQRINRLPETTTDPTSVKVHIYFVPRLPVIFSVTFDPTNFTQPRTQAHFTEVVQGNEPGYNVAFDHDCSYGPPQSSMSRFHDIQKWSHWLYFGIFHKV